ncbi:MAG TPA: O-antigen ligase family protein [Verrucomicrobiae bacterium]|nr:O-antigen ligase family protein [Verrucomicrobiae bacterium]
MSPRFLSFLVASGALFLAGWFGLAIADNNYLPMIGFAALVGGVALLALPHLFGGIAFALYYSNLTAPGIPGLMDLFAVISAALVVVFLLRTMIQHQFSPPPRFAAYGLLVALWLLIVMGVRGAGFRVLGSDTWGGMFYLRLLSGFAFVFATAQVRLSPKQWSRVFNFMMLTTFLPVMADVVLIFGFMPTPLFMFLRPSSGIGFSMMAAQALEGIVRYLSAGTAGVILCLWIFSRASFDRLFGRAGLVYGPLLALAFGLAAVSGFRIRILEIVLFIAIAGALQRGWSFLRVSLILGVAICGFAALYPVARHLPLPAQRSVAWLPGIDINASAKQDAQGTLNWRVELWKRAIEEAPKYLVVGKGYSFLGEESMDAYTFRGLDELRWAVVSSSYHNGPLSMLLGLGVPGLIASMLWIASMVRYAITSLRRPWQSQIIQLLFLAAATRLLVSVAIFFTLYGDVQASFPELLYLGALMVALSYSDQALASKQDETEIAVERVPG